MELSDYVQYDGLEPPAQATLAKGYAMPATQLAMRLDQVGVMSRVMARFMGDYDAVLTPATSRVAPPTGRFATARYAADDETYWHNEMDCYIPLPLFSITGQPALMLPLYWSDAGLPLGVQFAGPVGGEALLFRLAGQLERARPWFGRRPPVWAGD